MTAAAAVAAGIFAAAASTVQAGAFPDRAMRIIVPAAPGGSAAMVARMIGNELAGATGRPVSVEHHAGASGNAGLDVVARAAADGYTLLLATNPLLIQAALFERIVFNPERDFEPVSLVASVPFVLVLHPVLPVKSVD
jgi:tripartite-type tricarboxylate transporter receptor subunit TctC